MSGEGRAALRTLARLRLRGWLRSARRSWPATALLALAALVYVAAMFGLSLAGFELPQDTTRRSVMAATAALWALNLLSRQGAPHDLSPADVDVLLAAPVDRALIVRRAIVGAMVSASAQAAVLSPALVVARRPIPAALSLLVYAALLQVSGRLVGAVAWYLPDRAWVRVARQVALVLFVALAVVAGGAASGRARWAVPLADHPVVVAALLPFYLISRVFVPVDAASGWMSLAALVLLVIALTALTVRLATPAWMEIAVTSADAHAAVMEGFREGGAGRVLGADPLFRGRLSRRPELALIQARLRSVLRMRLLRRTLAAAILYGLLTGAVVRGENASGTLVFATSASAFLVATALGAVRGEVHGEIDRVVELRAMPIGPLALFASFLVPAVLLVQAATLPVIVIGVLLWRPTAWEVASAVAGVLTGVPLYLGTSAVLYLLLPYRIRPGLGAPSAILRQMVIPMVSIVASVLVLTSLGVVSILLSLFVTPAVGLSAWLLATLVGTGLTVLVGGWRIQRVEAPPAEA